jgi:PAS domain S-box-containing protein
MTKEIFDQQLALSLRRLEELWQRVDELPKLSGETQQQAEGFPAQQQELLRENLEELSISLQELQVAAEELRQQNDELAERHRVVEAECQRYKELFEFAPDGYLVTDTEAMILQANQTAAQLLNFPLERLVTKPLVVFVAAEERRDYYSKLHQLQKGESIKNWQVQVQRWHGTCFRVSFTVVPIQDSQGQVVGLRWQLQDLSPAQNIDSTGQTYSSGRLANGHENSKAASQEQSLFCAMFERAAIGIALLDSEGCVIKTNPALQEMLGYGEEELQTVFPKLMNLDKVGLESVVFQQLMTGQRHSYQREKRYLTQDGSVQWGRLTFSRVQGTKAEPAFATCILENITELHQLKAAQEQAIKQQQAIQQQQAIKQLEGSHQEETPASIERVEPEPQQLEALVEQLGKILNDILSSTPEFFFVYDQSGKYIYVNRAAAEALGLTQSDFISKTWQQLELPAEIMERLDAQRAVVFTTGQPITDEASFATVDGVRDYEYTISPISNVNSEPEAVVVTVRDITEQKRATVAASVAMAKEEEFSALKSHFSYFASVVVHELRNPLNNIFACAKLIETNTQQGTDEKKLNYLQLIQVNVRRINQLLHDLLLMKKVEAKELRLNPASIDLIEFCRELTEEVQQGAGFQHKLTFTSQGQCSGVHIDKKLLRQILTNLLLNAIKDSPEGSEVKLDVVCQERQAIFRIQDSGSGIPQADQELLFKTLPPESNVNVFAGSGLGLIIVKQCVDLQGGEISVESQEGVGTTLTVTLPLNGDN